MLFEHFAPRLLQSEDYKGFGGEDSRIGICDKTEKAVAVVVRLSLPSTTNAENGLSVEDLRAYFDGRAAILEYKGSLTRTVTQNHPIDNCVEHLLSMQSKRILPLIAAARRSLKILLLRYLSERTKAIESTITTTPIICCCFSQL
jgi:hypothetical protein